MFDITNSVSFRPRHHPTTKQNVVASSCNQNKKKRKPSCEYVCPKRRSSDPNQVKVNNSKQLWIRKILKLFHYMEAIDGAIKRLEHIKSGSSILHIQLSLPIKSNWTMSNLFRTYSKYASGLRIWHWATNHRMLVTFPKKKDTNYWILFLYGSIEVFSILCNENEPN